MTELEHHAARLWQLLSEEADDFPVDQINRSSRLARDLNLSGLQRMALAYRIEAEFSVSFSAADFDAITATDASVEDVLSAVLRHLNQSQKET